MNLLPTLGLLAFLVSSVVGGLIPLTEDCIKGVTFEGTPKGVMKTINGVNTYVAKAERASNPRRALLLLTDIFGLPLVNSKLMADDFAANGFDTFIPDYLNGDPVPLDDPTFNMTAWLPNHGEAQTMPVLLATIAGLKKQGFQEFASTGYCFGGLYSTRLSQQNLVKVGTMAHPSLLTTPDDFNTLLAESHVPVQMNSAELDTAFSPVVQAVADSILGDGKYKPGYSRPFFTGVGHGFAVRANLSDPVAKAAKEGAFFAAVEWLKKH
ncbi:dienelactone hydrolase endo-1,3,1,4-beta-D-glucanase [Lyophyllum atratum]|nr:dienelactone hydrolase endo-1,3,1,4-beta-D-glucanase [Lyophyllum atratum]